MKTSCIKRTIALFIFVASAVCLFGCFESSTYEKDGVTYRKTDFGWCVTHIDDLNTDSSVKNIYLLEEINGERVSEVNGFTAVGKVGARFTLSDTERIYFPWCIERTFPRQNVWYKIEKREPQLSYLISASTVALIDTFDFGHNYVIPYVLYTKLLDESAVNVNLGESISSFLETKSHLFSPANISYFFNYEDNPNEGYFFVDLVEESGKLTKPPYDPKREGRAFVGWYKEAECINEWNFDVDEVSVEFDEDGNRIYEEICLYAKWTEN